MAHLIPAPRPVPTREDRMTDARTAPSFATYLDAHERDQLDARAATAEQERDEALDDLRDVREQLDEAVSILAKVGDAISPTGERPEEALGTLVRDVQAMVEQRDSLREQLDQMTAAAADHRKIASEALNAKYGALGQVARLRAELGRAQELIAVVDDATERIDRARAKYDTTQGEAEPTAPVPSRRAQEEPGEPACSCPDCDVSTMADRDAGRWPTVKGLDPSCPIHGKPEATP